MRRSSADARGNKGQYVAYLADVCDSDEVLQISLLTIKQDNADRVFVSFTDLPDVC
ncbi:MAG: hypothetical protein QM714_11040 [Nocardioides sp.]|uniref:hypothetical protein n=1 Tax=Nocardioides sp. TaxID=35761 RepID=UPI0039E56881